MVNSGDITVTNHRLRKAMTNLNDDDFSRQAKKLGEDLKSELKIQVGKVMEICADTETATVQITGSSKTETCLIAHDIFSEGMSIDGFPQGTTEIRHKKQYITPSVNLYGLIVTVDDNGKDKKILLSYINRKTWNKLDNVKAGEYKLQVGDNIISLTDRYIKIKSDNLFINGMPYVESKKVIEDHKENEFLDMVYPVGSIYMSINDTNPHKLFGGVWEQIEDRFLLASGSNYSAGSTGGEATHTLTVSEIPSHRHSRRTQPQGFAEQDKTKSEIISPAGGSAKAVTKYSDYTGGGGSHNNMPPYLTVYMWKRVS